MIRNVIFDLGNVLLTWRPREFLLQFTPDTQRIEKFLPRVPLNPTWYEIDRGAITLDQARSIFLERNPEDADLIKFYFDHWLEMFTPIEGTIDLLAQVKQRGFRIFALSNLTQEAYAYASQKYDFFHVFDGIVLSFQEHLIKPERAIYEHLLARYQLDAAECVYIDDLPEFIAVAKELGMNGIVFTSPAALRADLHQLSVL